VEEVSFQALADMVDPPPASPRRIRTYLVNAPHGGLLERLSVRRLIHGILEGDPTIQGSADRSLLARIVSAGARPWETPSLPLTLDPAGTCPGS
jgi:hypothetical protein